MSAVGLLKDNGFDVITLFVGITKLYGHTSFIIEWIMQRIPPLAELLIETMGLVCVCVCVLSTK